MPLTPAFRRQRQADLCKFQASLVYKSSYRTAELLYKEVLSQEGNKKTELLMVFIIL